MRIPHDGKEIQLRKLMCQTRCDITVANEKQTVPVVIEVKKLSSKATYIFAQSVSFSLLYKMYLYEKPFYQAEGECRDPPFTRQAGLTGI